ncbi:hypothetical protein ANTPLA_LOCUS8827 [Anthophora plagiata]
MVSDDCIFQQDNAAIHTSRQDGCSPHNAQIVRNYLNLKFGEHWLGTCDPIAWPPRSPDLSPLNFFFMELFTVDSLCCSNTK